MIYIKFVCDSCGKEGEKMIKGKNQYEFIDAWDCWNILPNGFDFSIGTKKLLCKKCKSKEEKEYWKKHPDEVVTA